MSGISQSFIFMHPIKTHLQLLYCHRRRQIVRSSNVEPSEEWKSPGRRKATQGWTWDDRLRSRENFDNPFATSYPSCPLHQRSAFQYQRSHPCYQREGRYRPRFRYARVPRPHTPFVPSQVLEIEPHAVLGGKGCLHGCRWGFPSMIPDKVQYVTGLDNLTLLRTLGVHKLYSIHSVQ